MDHVLLEELLAKAEWHVTKGQYILGRQRELVEELERSGRSATKAREVLIEFEKLHWLRVNDRELLRKELRNDLSRVPDPLLKAGTANPISRDR